MYGFFEDKNMFKYSSLIPAATNLASLIYEEYKIFKEQYEQGNENFFNE